MGQVFKTLRENKFEHKIPSLTKTIIQVVGYNKDIVTKEWCVGKRGLTRGGERDT